MKEKLTRKENALLRQLNQEAWEAELSAELEELFETFCRWADKGLSAFDVSDRIHEFHNGVSRELYNRYTVLDPSITVSRAIAVGILDEKSLDATLFEKLSSLIDTFRDEENE